MISSIVRPKLFIMKKEKKSEVSHATLKALYFKQPSKALMDNSFKTLQIHIHKSHIDVCSQIAIFTV